MSDPEPSARETVVTLPERKAREAARRTAAVARVSARLAAYARAHGGRYIDSGAYHADLVRRVGRAIPNVRPAIIPPELAHAIDETRRFRHVARKSHDDFSPARANPSVAAAAVVRDALEPAIAAFRAAIDA